MYYILFNPKAGAGTGETTARKLDELLKGEKLTYLSVFDIKDYRSFLAELNEDDKIVIVGGDGSRDDQETRQRGEDRIPFHFKVPYLLREIWRRTRENTR